MRILTFLFLSCILHNCEIIHAKYLGIATEVFQTLREQVQEIWRFLYIKPFSPDICQTPTCINSALKLLQAMDPKESPCDDFYKFACGNWLKTTMIPKHSNLISAFNTIYGHIQKQLKISLEEEIRPTELRTFRLAKNFYKACMNKTAIEKKGLQPVQEIMETLGGWPVLEGDMWKDEDFEWKESTYKLSKIGYLNNFFFKLEINTDEKNNTKRVLVIDQASLGLNREYLINGLSDKMVNSYYDYMVDLAVIFGAERARAVKELKDSLKFEIQLANISLSNIQRRKVTILYNPMTVKELSEKYSTISWKEFFNTYLEPIVAIGDDEVVIVHVPSFFEEFEKLMQQTPKKIQANYLMWKVVLSSASYLTDEIRNRELKFSTAVTGRTAREDRWMECLSMTTKNLRVSVGALYVRKYFHEDSKKTAVKIVNNIRKEFKKILMQVDWMDEKTKMNAFEKVEAMRCNIAYPDELLDDNILEEFFEKLEITPDDYFQSVLNASRMEMEYSISQLRTPVNKSDWVSHSRTTLVNAFYNPNDNSYDLPAGLLQDVFFNNERPQYMNYATIGFLAGHEITHGFDDLGKEFDKDGNLYEWWNPETKKKFLKKTECIIKQYGNYTVEEVGLKLHGMQTLGENIADNGGIKEAYLAYQDWVKRNGPEAILPGLNYSPSQIFWISAANIWCRNVRSEFLKRQILTGAHSPAHYRVLGSFANRPEFAKDFNCPLGSRMNPFKKCSVW